MQIISGVVILLCILTAALGFVTEAKAGCQGGFSNYAGHCYFYADSSEPKLTWFEASALCVSKGAYLVNIGSHGEQAYIERMIRNTARENLWIGGNDIGQNQQYWTKGNAVGSTDGYTNWKTGEPSRLHSGNREPCMCIWGDSGDRWNDLDCFARIFYICEHDNSQY
ncbi:unnamed protein product [Owenia fusiformis]|uniref:Uncharacterized protein n=1 Tax=Owenia fusiformis TaxID=6347 RepID=A0A8J1TEE9_OWEFU|nr:unnamed protein product [Owenia fusiformis]